MKRPTQLSLCLVLLGSVYFYFHTSEIDFYFESNFDGGGGARDFFNNAFFFVVVVAIQSRTECRSCGSRALLAKTGSLAWPTMAASIELPVHRVPANPSRILVSHPQLVGAERGRSSRLRSAGAYPPARQLSYAPRSRLPVVPGQPLGHRSTAAGVRPGLGVVARSNRRSSGQPQPRIRRFDRERPRDPARESADTG